MSLAKQIKAARLAKGMTQKELAVLMGVGQGVVSAWEKEDEPGNSKSTHNPRAEKHQKLWQVLGISSEGEGLSFNEMPEGWEDYSVKTKNVADDDSSNIVTVPEYDIRLSAGGGYIVDDETTKDTWVFNRTYIEELRLSSADLIVAEVEGDSMEPKLFTGDRVMVNQSDKNVNRPGIFAIWDTSALVVKRIEKIPNTDPVMLRLISDNQNHSKYDVPAENTRIIGRIVWFARRL